VVGLRWLGIALLVFVGTAVVLGAAYVLPTSAQVPVTREYTLTARSFSYDPNVITVNKGDRVILRVKSEDVTHGLYVDDYDLQVHVHPGDVGTVEFVADKPGKFKLRCADTCGPLHPFMIGELVVQPNTPFSSSTGLAIVTAAVTLGLVWRRKEPDDA